MPYYKANYRYRLVGTSHILILAKTIKDANKLAKQYFLKKHNHVYKEKYNITKCVSSQKYGVIHAWETD